MNKVLLVQNHTHHVGMNSSINLLIIGHPIDLNSRFFWPLLLFVPLLELFSLTYFVNNYFLNLLFYLFVLDYNCFAHYVQ